jgi:hypothetical protein
MIRCVNILSLIYTLTLLIFPILDIIFVYEYSSDTVCSYMDLSIKEWLYFKAILMIVNILFMLLYLYSVKRSISRYLYWYIIILLQIVTVIWIIIGSIIFFKNCSNIEPHIFIRFSIISGYIYTSSIIFFILCKRDLQNRREYPIFTDYDIL